MYNYVNQGGTATLDNPSAGLNGQPRVNDPLLNSTIGYCAPGIPVNNGLPTTGFPVGHVHTGVYPQQPAGWIPTPSLNPMLNPIMPSPQTIAPTIQAMYNIPGYVPVTHPLMQPWTTPVPFAVNPIINPWIGCPPAGCPTTPIASVNPFMPKMNPFVSPVNPSIHPFTSLINPFMPTVNPVLANVNPFNPAMNPWISGATHPINGIPTPFGPTPAPVVPNPMIAMNGIAGRFPVPSINPCSPVMINDPWSCAPCFPFGALPANMNPTPFLAGPNLVNSASLCGISPFGTLPAIPAANPVYPFGTAGAPAPYVGWTHPQTNIGSTYPAYASPFVGPWANIPSPWNPVLGGACNIGHTLPAGIVSNVNPVTCAPGVCGPITNQWLNPFGGGPCYGGNPLTACIPQLGAIGNPFVHSNNGFGTGVCGPTCCF